jgi:hypothetical protein
MKAHSSRPRSTMTELTEDESEYGLLELLEE